MVEGVGWCCSLEVEEQGGLDWVELASTHYHHGNIDFFTANVQYSNRWSKIEWNWQGYFIVEFFSKWWLGNIVNIIGEYCRMTCWWRDLCRSYGLRRGSRRRYWWRSRGTRWRWRWRNWCRCNCRWTGGAIVDCGALARLAGGYKNIGTGFPVWTHK